MGLELEKIWAYQIVPEDNNLSGKEQDKSSAWAQLFVDYYGAVQNENCMPVVFATELDTKGQTSIPNQVEETVHTVCFGSEVDQAVAVSKLVKRLQNVIDGRTGTTLNIVTLLLDPSNSSEKHLVTWTYPSDNAYEMAGDGTVKLVEQIFIQKKLLRKAGFFSVSRDLKRARGTTRGKIYDRLAKYNLSKGAGYWRKYLECVPELNSDAGTEIVKRAIYEVLKQDGDHLDKLSTILTIQSLMKQQKPISLEEIINKFPSPVRIAMNEEINPTIHRDTRFQLKGDVLKNHFKYVVKQDKDGLNIVIPFDYSGNNFVSEVDGEGEMVRLLPTRIVDEKVRSHDV